MVNVASFLKGGIGVLHVFKYVDVVAVCCNDLFRLFNMRDWCACCKRTAKTLRPIRVCRCQGTEDCELGRTVLEMD